MTNYYPLTAAQKMHHNWIMDYGTQQVSVMLSQEEVEALRKAVNFGLDNIEE